MIQKQIKAPFVPKTSDPEKMRQSQNEKKVVHIKELEESVIPDENVQLLAEINDQVFSAFGIDIDKTALDRAKSR